MMSDRANGPENVPQAKIEKTLAKLNDLPSLPAVLMEALSQIDDNSAATGGIVDKIAQDPSLAARILRIANSPFFGLPREIDSLRHAVVLLGLARVRELLVSACFRKLLPIPKAPFDYPRFWHHSLAVGTYARLLAEYAVISQESAFTAGLVHDIGRLAIGSYFPEAFSAILEEYQKGETDILAAEQRILGLDHTAIGGMLATRWNFPDAIKEAIEFHHTKPASNHSNSLSTVVYAANLMIGESERNLGGEPAPNNGAESDDHESAQVLRILGIPADEAAVMAETARDVAGQLAALY